MLKLRSFICILLLPMFLIACSNNLLSQKEKTNHISSKQIAKAIAPFLPTGAKWTSPKFGKIRTPFFAADLNHDQQAEGIGLFKAQNQLGIIIIEKEGQKWKKIEQRTFAGDQFQLAGAEDLTGDTLPEIILSMQGETELEAQTKVLQWSKQHTLSPILDEKTSASVLDDLDQDHQPDLIVFQQLPDMKTEMILYKPYQHKLHIKDAKKIDGSVEMSYITVGKVQKNRQGIVADIFQGAHGGKAGIFYIQKGKLYDAFDSLNSEQNNRLYNVKSQDINHDGIIDIAFTEMVNNSQSLSNAEQPSIYSWYNWSENNQLKLVYEQYVDDILGLRISYPAQWRGKIRASINPDTRTISFGLPLPQNKLTLLIMAEISAVKKSDWPKLKQSFDAYKEIGTFDYSILSNQGNTVYIATIYNKKAAQQMNAGATYDQAEQSGMIPTHSSLKKWIEIYHDAYQEYLRLPELP
ncbi:hypothetical protein MK805_16990 [Shimazuella sp. AN120528]|uniref:hypothetical protein n=1 Tax=Shimazuella soli TaxID=1892854 RepID=UPI001F0F17DF|nr:hypothetical protein [Shimazuella soli]MCH5586633.1 hypothetical protein [Shimazuella soli]